MSEPAAIPDEHLGVRLNGVLAGRLWQQRQRLVFGYDPVWLARKSIPVLSQSLPPQVEPHEGPEVEAFFGNLLPEGDVRSAVARALRISERNDYALLDAIGGDCAGALMLTRPDAPIVETSIEGSLLTTAELRRMVTEAPNRPLLAGAAVDVVEHVDRRGHRAVDRQPAQLVGVFLRDGIVVFGEFRLAQVDDLVGTVDYHVHLSTG